MTQSANALVSQTMASLGSMDVPQQLRHSIDQHRRNLLSLAASLLAGGQPEAVVEKTLDVIFTEYRNELTNTIIALRENSFEL
jgi:hypothetical protein